jgi:preprotein translocase subunit SecD
LSELVALVMVPTLLEFYSQAAGITGGSASITGNFSSEEARDLEVQLRGGSLPLPVKVIEQRTIGATLGAENVQRSLAAGLFGLALVAVFMVVVYRLPGLVSVVALSLYGLYNLALYSLVPVTLTLPGIAGFVLSIGMAVDANFLVFERIREELDTGKSVRTAIDEGFDHAWSAIVDTHVTTALTAAILYQFGTGPVRGFAVTLLAGIIASLASAIFFVRTLFYVWLARRKQAPTTLSI